MPKIRPGQWIWDTQATQWRIITKVLPNTVRALHIPTQQIRLIDRADIWRSPYYGKLSTRPCKKLYVVQLEPECWLADWDGDPGRTKIKQIARVFASRKDACLALAEARQYRPFKQAVIEKAVKPTCFSRRI